jgi:CheY-like chemotaxis protein
VSKVLVVESDSVFAAVLEDRLHVAGHAVVSLADPARAAANAAAEHADLVFLDAAAPAWLAAVRELRSQPGTRTLPVLVLSDSAEPAARIAALRAGVDDYLSRPCDLEELLLRAERLLGRRLAGLSALHGDLANHPSWAVLQYLGQIKKSGSLVVRSPGGAGQVELRAGELVAARWQTLYGREALLALLCAEEGTFSFVDGDVGGRSGGEDLPMNELLMQAAWLKDEMGRRRQHLPATGEPLRALATALPPVDADYEALPLARILLRVSRQPGLRLFDLVADETEAPLTTRVAVAWLVEHGLLGRLEAAAKGVQNTVEISRVMIFDVAVAGLAAAARAAGLAATPLLYLALVEPEVWPALKGLIEQAPGYRDSAELTRLVREVDAHGAGSAAFPNALGDVALRVQVLGGEPRIDAVGLGCAGVLVWLDGLGSIETVRSLVEWLEASGLPATGLLVAATPEAQREAQRLTKKTKRWRSSPHAPQSFLGLLRLLYPHAQ